MGSVDRPPRALAKQVEDDLYILVVNEHYEGLGVCLASLAGRNGAQASLVGDPHGCALKEDRVREGSLILHMPGYSAAVLAIRRE